jgi:hypothetical protein
MKRILILVLVAVIGVAAVAVAGDEAKKEEAKPVTLTGEVIDMYCYMSGHGGKGPEHAKCATACITKGIPVGFLTADGTLYVIIGKDHQPANADVAAYAGKQSTITGKVTENNGVKAIELITIADAKEEKKG